MFSTTAVHVLRILCMAGMNMLYGGMVCCLKDAVVLVWHHV
jgi:hypothetical protein